MVNDDFIRGFRAGAKVCITTIELVGHITIAAALQRGVDSAIADFLLMKDEESNER